MPADIEYKLASGATVLGLSQITALLLGVAFSVLIARMIGPENYGIVGISLTLPTLLVNLLELGTGSVLIKYAASTGSARRVYVWSTLIVRLVLGLAGSALTYLFADVFANLMARPFIADYIRMLSWYVLGFSILSALGPAFTGIRKYVISGLMNILQYVLRGFLAVTLVMASYGTFGVIASYSITYSVLGVAYLILLAKFLGTPVFSIKALHEVLKLSFPLFMSSIAGLIVTPVVNSLLAHNTTDFDVGNYGVGSVSLAPIGVVLSSVSAATLSVLPVVENVEEVKRRTSALSSYGSAVLLFLIGGYISVLAPTIYILYGPSYRDSPLYATIISLGHLASAALASNVLNSYLIIVGATRWNSIAGIVGSVTTIALSLVLIPSLKACGAAISVATGLASSSAVIYIVARRCFRVEVSMKTVLRVSAPSLAGIICSRALLYGFKCCPRFTSALFALLIGGTMYILAYLTLLPLFLGRTAIKKIVEFSCGLKFLGKPICLFGKLYLKILGVEPENAVRSHYLSVSS